MNMAFVQMSLVRSSFTGKPVARTNLKVVLPSSMPHRRRVAVPSSKPSEPDGRKVRRYAVSQTAVPPTAASPSPEQDRGQDVKRLVSLFWRLAAPYWKIEPSSRKDILGVLALTVLQSGISVGFSYISRDFWTALNTKNFELFSHQAALFFGALVVFTPIQVFYQYYREMCALKWREWITQTVLAEYCARRNFYNLDAEGTVDNPDQRIAQDLNSFTSESLGFMLTILVSCIDLASFSAILFSIYPPLFGILVAYAATGTALTTIVGKRLVSLKYKQLVREADFRYSLIRFRDNAESIAFFGGENRERSEILRRLAGVVHNLQDVIGLQRQLGFLQTGYRYIVQILPAVATAPLYFRGQIELGGVTQSFGAFSHILGDLSLIVSRFDSLAQFGAGIDRLGEFVEALEVNLAEDQRIFRTTKEDSVSQEKVSFEGNGVVKSRIELKETGNSSLIVRNLTLSTPSGSLSRTLIRNLSFEVKQGTRLLVAGPSGVGKSSFLRAIAGLWDNGSGMIERPHASSVFFLPQRPYCTLGTLRANLLYPKDVQDENSPSDEALLRILDLVDLHELPKRMGGFDTTRDWADTLSLGEQQRLQFARLLIARPTLAVVDEGSAALSIEAESRMYGLLETMGITVVSIGHRPSLARYHDAILRLGGDNASWVMEDIKQEQKDRVVVQSL